MYPSSCKKGTKSGGIAISAVTPGAHNIDRVLETWVRARVLTKYDVTKAGYYVIMVNDGDRRLTGGTGNGTQRSTRSISHRTPALT